MDEFSTIVSSVVQVTGNAPVAWPRCSWPAPRVFVPDPVIAEIVGRQLEFDLSLPAPESEVERA